MSKPVVPAYRLIGLLVLISALLLAPIIRATDNRAETPQPTLLESLWETLKQTLEKTTTALTSQKSAKTMESNHPQGSRHNLSSRRIALVRKTLQDHFTHRFVNNLPGWETYFTNSVPKPASRHTHRQALRWKEGRTSRCFFFSESAAAYWSFQWCPMGIVMQGIRTKDDRLNVQHVLGSFVPFSPTDTFSSHDSAQKFAQEVQSQYPSSRIELYHNGDPCVKSASNRRMTVVVQHERASKFCLGDWADKYTDLVIESVEEPHECKYIIHVCAPSPHTTPLEIKPAQEPPITQSDAEELNQAMAKIKQSLQIYLKESTADTQRKANPDRTTSLHLGLPPLPLSRIQSNLQLIREMFQHAYDSYMYNAFPASDIKPMTCQPASFDLVKIPGLTLIDSLDTLIVLGNYTEFARAVERLRGLHQYLKEENERLDDSGLFALNQNVSVFETNIRVLGGLLSAHQMAEAFMQEKVPKHHVWSQDGNTVLVGGVDITIPETPYPCHDLDGQNDKISLHTQCAVASAILECKTEGNEEASTTCRNITLNFWKYDGILLELAQDIGDRLLPAFSTKTGIPYGTVNLLSGIPRGETTIASLAGGGTLSLEMELLSRLTGNPSYGKAAKLATRALWMRRSQLGLVGKHICTHRGEWTETLSGIGSNSDSFYEYLIKHHILFPEDDDFWLQLVSAYGGIYNESRSGEWYGDVEYQRGQSNGMSVRRVFEALMAFYPGMQVLLGEVTPAARSLNSFFLVREYLGFLPERFNYLFWKVDAGGGQHFLRPELLESAYFMHRATKGFQTQLRKGNDVALMDSSGWQWAADFALHTLESNSKTVCGYASLKSVSPVTTGEIRPNLESDMSRNLKDEMPSFFLSETLKYLYLIYDENNILHTDKNRDWVFTTEAHPIHNVDIPQEDSLNHLKKRLVEKLKARSQGTEQERNIAINNFLDDKWTDGSTSVEYSKQTTAIGGDLERKARLQRTASEQASHGPDFWQTSQMVEPILTVDQVSVYLDFFNETQNKQNAAHLTFGKLGNGLEITNSCPNFYLPDWRWIRALNGGATDYSDAYVSSAMDKPVPGESTFRTLGSLDAIGFHGSGAHVVDLFDESKKCPVVDRSLQPTNDGVSKVEDNGPSKDKLNMGGDLGDFEVSVFPGSKGFFIQRVNTGEMIVVTFIKDEASGDPENAFVMVYSTVPYKEGNADIRTGNSDSELLRNGENMEKFVAMADSEGNVFSCQVEVILRELQSIHGGKEIAWPPPDEGEVCYDDSDDWIMATYPCAPGMFGPAHMTELVQTGGMIVESTSLRKPDDNDEYGCKVKNVDRFLQKRSESFFEDVVLMADGSQGHERNKDGVGAARSINMVHRGHCTFEEKAIIQKDEFNAKAVIVINSDEEELFLMSGGGFGRSDHHFTTSSLPPAVLITKADWKALSSLTESLEVDEASEMVVRISIVQDHVQVFESNKILSVRNNLFWPAVRTRPGIVQIFAKGGWGVHAVEQNSNINPSTEEWQLFLIRHDMHFEEAGKDVMDNSNIS